jgi:aspartyl-tRNA(Asn)/glutamyl-tRNA(Gln) amidotransferase subunit A
VTAFPATVVEIAAAVRSGRLDWRAPAEDSLAALSAADLNATITLVDQLPPRPRHGPLAGVPILVKDLIDTAGLRTTYGSDIFRDHIPHTSAVCVRRLREAGAIVVGKANLHEFAWGVSSQNPHWGHVVNPRNTGATPGGSSGGNAAALAAGLTPAGLGTDTAGSLRIPAACCGVVGFKPSNGAVPSQGVFPLAPTLDCVGPMARTVDDCALLFSVLAGVRWPVAGGGRLRVAAATTALAERLRGAGVPTVLREQPVPPPGCAAILDWQAWQTHRELVARHGNRYGSNVRAKLERAAGTTADAYRAARQDAVRWRALVERGRDYDVLVTATMPVPPPAADFDELAGRESVGRNTRWVNILGWAAVAVGNIQVTGPSDANVLRAGAIVEERLGADATGRRSEKRDEWTGVDG